MIVSNASSAASAARGAVSGRGFTRVMGGMAVVLAFVASACFAQALKPGTERTATERTIRMATTTSTENSGLLGWLLPAFEQKYGYTVRVVSVGTGAALKIGANGDADLVLVHARAAEEQFVASGFGIDRRDVMFNDFVIVGPKTDPAGIRTAGSAAASLKSIVAMQQRFVSRGDDSGTHQMELALWRVAGGLSKWPGYLAAGRGMGEVLTMADELRGYTLTDRGTFSSMRSKLDLVVLVEGDRSLSNPYGIIAVNPVRHPHVNAQGARALMDWMTSPEGQRRIASFQIDGQSLFFPSATGPR
ncbi:MAG: substrate-binding domain-containing protein [Proteobacteria bacterium]|nr:substrate-binding domain-containing protein [Burkholderiales bacterium]